MPQFILWVLTIMYTASLAFIGIILPFLLIEVNFPFIEHLIQAFLIGWFFIIVDSQVNYFFNRDDWLDIQNPFYNITSSLFPICTIAALSVLSNVLGLIIS